MPEIDYPEAPYPDDVFRQLLEPNAIDGIDTKLAFDEGEYLL
ncbi:MAG: hypothetical protein P4L26_17420 [Terracidiphilus sp.]|nr:hypothetical protein [Terracidiphilus sp.]